MHHGVQSEITMVRMQIGYLCSQVPFSPEGEKTGGILGTKPIHADPSLLTGVEGWPRLGMMETHQLVMDLLQSIQLQSIFGRSGTISQKCTN